MKTLLLLPKRDYASLLEWREENRLSQWQAATLFDISTTTYSRIERGELLVKGDLAKRLMDVTGVPLAVLVGVTS